MTTRIADELRPDGLTRTRRYPFLCSFLRRALALSFSAARNESSFFAAASTNEIARGGPIRRKRAEWRQESEVAAEFDELSA